MSRLRFHEDGSWAVALPLLLTVYLPRTPALGNHFFAYGALVVVLGLVLASSFLESQRFDRRILTFLFLMVAIAAVTSFSLLVNAGSVLTTGVIRVLRPVLYVILLLYAFQAARLTGREGVRRGLLSAAYAILLGQLVIGSSQAVGLDLFDPIYTAEKARPLGGLFRITGSLGNPNFFGWVVAQAGIVILFLRGDRGRYGWLGLTTLLVVAAGSRTLLLLFPIMVVVAHKLRRRGAGGVMSGVVVGGVLVVTFAGFVVAMRDLFPYLGQLRDLFSTASLASIHALEQRVDRWFQVGEVFREGGAASWIFGLSDRPLTQVLDNDYLYVLYRTGIVGLLVHVLFVGYIICTLRRDMRTDVARLGLQYVLFALAFGLVADTLGGWFTPIWLVLFVGMAMGLQNELEATHGSYLAGGAK